MFANSDPAGAIAFQLLLACNVLAAFIHPVFLIGVCYALFAAPPQFPATTKIAPAFVATLVCGYVLAIALDLIGLRRRGLLAHAWVLLLMPLHWLLLSLAAWRALYQLFYAPQRWEKTAHGLAKTSRLSKAEDGPDRSPDRGRRAP